MVIHPYAKIWYAYVKEQKHITRLKSMGKYNFDIEVKGQGHTEFMNVPDTSYHGDTVTRQTKYDLSQRTKKLRPEHKAIL